MSRKAISKRLRFEVFKRDSFTCQYCGKKAPDVLLEIDHIHPVSKGGTNDVLNLITACKDCNAGKSDKLLSDSAVLDKQREQLEELQERKEQIEMMFQWQQELAALDEQVLDQLAGFWSELVKPFHLSESGHNDLSRLLGRYGIDEIMEAMRISVRQYVKLEEELPTKESVEEAWRTIGGICANRRLFKEDPTLKEIYYIRGILRNRLYYVNEQMALELLKLAVELGANITYLKKHALDVRNWTEWRTEIEEFIQGKLEMEDGEDSA